MMRSRSPRSESTVVSYASWQASGSSALPMCSSSWLANLLRASDFRPVMPYLDCVLASSYSPCQEFGCKQKSLQVEKRGRGSGKADLTDGLCAR
jgi:hypothetical protein